MRKYQPFNKNMTYSEYLDLLKGLWKEYNPKHPGELEKEIEEGILSAIAINDPNKRNRLMKLSDCINKELKEQYGLNGVDASLPLVATAATLIDKRYDDISHLNNEQLMLLCRQIFALSNPYIDRFVEIYKDGRILDAAIKKEDYLGEQSSILLATEHVFFDEYIDNGVKSKDFDKKKEDAVKFISICPKDKINAIVNEAVANELDEVNKNPKK